MGTKQAVRFGSVSVGVVFDLHLAQRQLSLQPVLKTLPLPDETAYHDAEEATNNAEGERRCAGTFRHGRNIKTISGSSVMRFYRLGSGV